MKPFTTQVTTVEEFMPTITPAPPPPTETPPPPVTVVSTTQPPVFDINQIFGLIVPLMLVAIVMSIAIKMFERFK